MFTDQQTLLLNLLIDTYKYLDKDNLITFTLSLTNFTFHLGERFVGLKYI